jgi:cyclohexanecarboxylate-CoA ligase
MVRRLKSALPALEHVVVADGEPVGDKEHTLESLQLGPEILMAPPDPRSLCHVGFTSGTTGEPKGVMNTHQTLYSVLKSYVAHVRPGSLGEPPVNLVASPVGHHTGYLWGVLLTAFLRGTAVYLDRWVPTEAARVIREERVTTMFSAPTFLQDLLLTDLAEDPDCPLRTVVVAGAPVPRSLPAVADAAFGCYVFPAWGMTELGIGISCAPHLPPAAQLTDGVPVPGTEVRILHDGREAGPGVTGALQIRGPGLFLGYLDLPAATAEVIDNEGWFTTGDTALRSDQGYILLEGRTKDIVIRGGENIPVAAVESLLFEHPDIVEATVVGLPDARLGERACAVIVPRGAEALTLDLLCEYLLQQGLSKHFLPERLELVDALPKTPSGKIRKADLRHKYAAE